MGYSCDRRATYILDGSECVQAFLDCCTEIQKHRENQEELLHLARSKNPFYSLFLFELCKVFKYIYIKNYFSDLTKCEL